MPAADGQVLIEAIERTRKNLPKSPEDPESDPDVFGQDWSIDAKRVDALVEVARRAVAGRGDAAQPTLVIHADLDAFISDYKHAEYEGGGVIPPETLMRLSCDCDFEAVFHDGERTLGVGRKSRSVPPHIMRQLRRRDRSCRFPGCHHQIDLQAHHVIHWIKGGLTELKNLGLLCPFHHKLVHEFGWFMTIGELGTPAWFKPDGRPFVQERAAFP
jgi:Domain of unknown function (DUF222)